MVFKWINQTAIEPDTKYRLNTKLSTFRYAQVKLLSQSSLLPKPLMDYDLRLLRIFKTTVECSGFSSAVTELGISRSTISVHMSNPEARMKLKLCVPGRSGFALTEAGQAVYYELIKLLETMNDFHSSSALWAKSSAANW